MSRRAALTIVALALLCMAPSTRTQRGGNRASVAARSAPHAAVARSIIGIHPGSPDYNVLIAEFAEAAAEARAAGAYLLYFSRDFDDLDSDGTATIMGALGHPVAITLSFFNLSAVSSNLPPECDADDWTGPTLDDCIAGVARRAGRFAERFLEPGDYIFLGNEAEERLEAHPTEIAAFKRLAIAVSDEIRRVTPGVRPGVVFGHDTADEATITATWDPRMGFLCLNGYGENADFTVGAPSAGIAALDDLETFAQTLTADWGICETGWPGPTDAASATLLGSDAAEQAAWAALLREWAKTTSARFVNVFIALDGVLEATGDSDANDAAGAISSPCFGASGALGGSPASSIIDTYICRLGCRNTDGTAKPCWGALW